MLYMPWLSKGMVPPAGDDAPGCGGPEPARVTLFAPVEAPDCRLRHIGDQVGYTFSNQLDAREPARVANLPVAPSSASYRSPLRERWPRYLTRHLRSSPEVGPTYGCGHQAWYILATLKPMDLTLGALRRPVAFRHASGQLRGAQRSAAGRHRAPRCFAGPLPS